MQIRRRAHVLRLTKVRVSVVGRVKLKGRAARTLYRGSHSGPRLEEGTASGPPIALNIKIKLFPDIPVKGLIASKAAHGELAREIEMKKAPVSY